MKEKLKRSDIIKISGTSSGLIIVFEILTVIFSFFYDKAASKTNYTSILYSKNFKFILFYICVYLITIPLLLLIFHLIRGKKTNHSLKRYFRKSERSFVWCAKWTIIGIGVFQNIGSLLTYITTIIRSHFNITVDSTIPQIKSNTLGYISLFTVTCILAPFFEELLFRGTVFVNNKPMGEGFAIVVTGLFFALWHINYSQFGIAFGLGAVMCLMTLKTKSLIPSMICHL